MAVAVDLLDAAAKAPTNLTTLWAADTLRAKVIAFWQAISPTFPDSDPKNQPVGGWIAVIAAFAPQIEDYEQAPALGENTIATLETAIDYIYRICKFGYYYNANGQISNDQATALLAAYNAQFA